MNYEEQMKDADRFMALTSLGVDEFNKLLSVFDVKCQKYFRYRTITGGHRAHPSSNEHGNTKLKGSGQKLFFILLYLKTNSLQELMGAMFGLSQASVGLIIKVLLDLLNDSLRQMGLQPYRDGTLLKKALEDHEEKVFLLDGTERIIQRNICEVAQEEEYSGKKHGHRIKNNVLSDNSLYIHYLSPTTIGKEHDKKHLDEFPVLLPKGSVLKVDLGYLGLEIEDCLVEIPFKKPKGGILSFGEAIYNKIYNSTRVLIEHVNSGIKRLRIVKDVIRIRSSEMRDQIMLAACSLHNLRLNRQTA